MGLLTGVILSWPLWNATARFRFPLLPVWGEATDPALVNRFNDATGWIVLIILLAGVITLPLRQSVTVALSVWLAWLCSLDLNRLQPWVWFYFLVVIAVFLGNKKKEMQAIAALRWLLAGVYFWSGFSKLTPYFAEDNFAWFCEAFPLTVHLGQNPALGYGIAFFEMTFAAGLMWEKLRPFFKWVVIGFHGVIIMFLLKLDWNWVVIPWNLAMAAMVWVLFCSSLHKNAGETNARPFPFLKQELLSGSGIFILLLAWIAPLFCFFQLWPFNLSWQLYSNTQPEATFFAEKVTGLAAVELEAIRDKYAFDGKSKILLDDWANDELKVPMFVSQYTFRQVGKYLCPHFSSDSTGLYVLRVARWDPSAETLDTIPCRELMPE
ncbi:MAG: hypothetical protein EPGJADBJ_01994 [Saprospiraceae bacterium]|nr:hypothetical protein [Saprospiraceae bacterium]